MKRHILLDGPIGCGKSMLLRIMLGESAEKAGGFFIQRMVDEGGVVRGFRMAPAQDMPREGVNCGIDDTENVFLRFGSNGPQHNDSVFLTTGVSLLVDIPRHPFAVLDEIGGFELQLTEFRDALKRALSGRVPCVGVLKSTKAAEKLSPKLRTPGEYLSASQELREWVINNPEIVLLQTTGKGDTAAEAVLRQWKDEYVGNI